MNDDKFNVCVIYGESRRMRSAISYAGKLAALIGASVLHVYLPGTVALSPEAAEAQRLRVQANVQKWQTIPVEVHDNIDLEFAPATALPPNAIIVNNGLALKRRDLTVLQPFEETNVLRVGGTILVPFGDGDSGLISSNVAIPLAKATTLDVMFYHTTWRNESVASDSPADHMCTEAASHQTMLQELATENGVNHTFAVEMADDVVMGMLNCALNGGVSVEEPNPVNLIVMAHGVNTHLGSYVEKALNVSATPILVIGNRGKPGAQNA